MEQSSDREDQATLLLEEISFYPHRPSQIKNPRVLNDYSTNNICRNLHTFEHLANRIDNKYSLWNWSWIASSSHPHSVRTLSPLILLLYVYISETTSDRDRKMEQRQLLKISLGSFMTKKEKKKKTLYRKRVSNRKKGEGVFGNQSGVNQPRNFTKNRR